MLHWGLKDKLGAARIQKQTNLRQYFENWHDPVDFLGHYIIANTWRIVVGG